MDIKFEVQTFYKVILFLVFGAAIIVGFYALMLAMIDAALWLKAGHTSGYTVSKVAAEIGLVDQQTGWVGLQKILDHLLAWPEWTAFVFHSGLFVMARSRCAVQAGRGEKGRAPPEPIGLRRRSVLRRRAKKRRHESVAIIFLDWRRESSSPLSQQLCPAGQAHFDSGRFGPSTGGSERT